MSLWRIVRQIRLHLERMYLKMMVLINFTVGCMVKLNTNKMVSGPKDNSVEQFEETMVLIRAIYLIFK